MPIEDRIDALEKAVADNRVLITGLYVMLSRNGDLGRKAFPGRGGYTAAEIKFIIDHYEEKTAKEIAAVLGRPAGGVYQKIHMMGIKKCPK